MTGAKENLRPSGNSAHSTGGGMRADGSPTITNCVFWGDTPDEIHVEWGSPVITFCDVQGGWPGTGNIDADPRFVDFPNSGYRLSPGSPCIDAADNTAVPGDTIDLDEDGDTTERIPLDLGGNLRFVDDPDTDDTGVPDPPDYPGVVDMGAYEGDEGDFDGDGLPDMCDPDIDDDGVLNDADVCDYTPGGTAVDGEGRPLGDIDQDCDTDLEDHTLFQRGFTGPLG